MTCGVPHTCEHSAVFDVTLGETLLSFLTILKTEFTFFISHLANPFIKIVHGFTFNRPSFCFESLLD